MNELSQIKQSIRKISGQKQSQPFFPAKVVSVDGETCSVSIDGLTITDVRLRAVINGENSKVLITPEQDSYVMVIDLSGGNFNDFAVIGYSQIEKIEIDTNKIILNGGSHNGLVNITELTQKLNQLVQQFNEHTHTVPNGTSAAPSALASTFNASDYEDTNITH